MDEHSTVSGSVARTAHCDGGAAVEAEVGASAAELPGGPRELLTAIRGRRATRIEQAALLRFARDFADKRCRDELVRRFDRLTGIVSARACKIWPELAPDLTQAARVGLLNAIDRYDISSGTGFAVFARTQILEEVMAEAVRSVGPCSVPILPRFAMAAIDKGNDSLHMGRLAAGDLEESIVAGTFMNASVRLDALSADEMEAVLLEGVRFWNGDAGDRHPDRVSVDPANGRSKPSSANMAAAVIGRVVRLAGVIGRRAPRGNGGHACVVLPFATPGRA